MNEKSAYALVLWSKSSLHYSHAQAEDRDESGQRKDGLGHHVTIKGSNPKKESAEGLERHQIGPTYF